MMKNIVKYILSIDPVSHRLKGFYGADTGLPLTSIQSAWASSNVWFFSQPKTGTTLICNVIAFYNSLKYDLESIDFDNIAKAGVGRKEIGNIERSLSDFVKFKTSSSSPVVVHTHSDLENVCSPKFFATTRNPLDFAVSAYFFWYKNRKVRADISFDLLVENLAHRFSKIHLSQLEAARRSKSYLFVSYEELILDQERVLENVIELIHGEVDSRLLERSIDMANPESLAKFEKKSGHAAVAKEGSLNQPHFIRSGKVGEGKEFFSEAQKNKFYKVLDSYDVSRDGRLFL